ncbi:MAG: hypothetical protein KDK23_00875 [Leptospiraceae bacterium]|nr:hypothetical protein [Leptospiraceae bacterium]
MAGGCILDVRRIQYELRKRRADEILDFAFVVIREKMGQIVRITAPFILAFLALNMALVYLIRASGEQESGVIQLLLLPVVLLELMVLQVPLFHMNARWLFEEKVADRTIWKDTGRTFLPFLGRIILPYLIQLVLAPLLLPLWNVLIRSFYRPEVLFLEGLRGRDLRRRISSLTSAFQVFTFWIFHAVLFWVAMYLSLTFCEAILELLRVQNYQQFTAFNLASPLFLLLLMLYSVFFAVSRFLFYVDARTYLEAWDLELQLIRGLDEMTSQKRIS